MPTNVSIEKLASDFINYKHALGYTYRSQEHIINRYVAFHMSHNEDVVPSKNVVQVFLEEASNTAEYLHCIVSVLREFCKYLYSIGYEETYLIPNKTGSAYTPNPPYFFTETEIEALFCQIDSVKKTKEFKGREIVITVFKVFLGFFCHSFISAVKNAIGIICIVSFKIVRQFFVNFTFKIKTVNVA